MTVGTDILSGSSVVLNFSAWHQQARLIKVTKLKNAIICSYSNKM